MPWFKVDDNILGNKKFARIPRADRMAATGLWTTLGSWCARELTGGLVEEHMISEVGGTRRQADSLVAAGLWVRVESGYQFVNWDEYQPTRESVESDRAAAKARQQRARDKARQLRDGNAVTDPSRRDDGVTNGVTHASVTTASRSPRPDPSLKEQKPSSPVGDDPLFDEFWAAYPKKVSKQDARRRWAVLVKTVDPRVIIVGAQRYGKMAAHWDKSIIKHPDGWLLGRRWEDETLLAVDAPVVDPHWTAPPPPDGIPSHLYAAWNRAHVEAHKAGRPGPSDWHELEAVAS